MKIDDKKLDVTSQELNIILAPLGITVLVSTNTVEGKTPEPITIIGRSVALSKMIDLSIKLMVKRLRKTTKGHHYYRSRIERLRSLQEELAQ